MARKGELNERQKEFVRQFLIWHNGTLAYKKAGYKFKDDRVAGICAAKMLGLAKVDAEIKRRQKSREKRTEITADLVVQETWANYERCLSLEELAAANKALEMLGRHTGAFPNKMELSGSVAIDVVGIEVITSPRRPLPEPEAK